MLTPVLTGVFLLLDVVTPSTSFVLQFLRYLMRLQEKIMASYEKLTLDRFKASLKEGKYVNLTGARRAIGKTTSWSAKEKEAAQELALKHFGGSAPKVAAKTNAKKTAKVKKAAAVKTKAVNVKTQDKPVRKPVTQVSSVAAGTSDEYRLAATDALGFASTALGELEHIKRLNPSLDIVASTKQVHGILDQAIVNMCHAIAGLPHPGKQAAAIAPRIELPEVRVLSQSDESETVGQVEGSGVSDEDLTPEERATKGLFLKNAEASVIAGLPRPA